MAANHEKENTPEKEQAKPWGRFTFVSKEPAKEADHIYFRNKVTTIGRNKRRCDIVIDKLFISSVHCVVQLIATDDTGKPTVKLSDNSRNGIWVNADRVGKGASATLGNGYTVHFTKPGTTPAGVTPMAYKFEFLTTTHESRPASPESEANDVPEDVNMTIVADESFEATQLEIPADPPSPAEKKRKREDEEPATVTVATRELERQLKAAESQLKATQSKLKAAEAQMATLGNELEQNMRVKVDKLAQENLSLMSKLEVATAVNLQLKTDLTAKDRDMQAKVKEAMKKNMEAASKEVQSLKEELTGKEQAMALKIKEAVKKVLEADKEKKAQEMAIKLKEATKKYQQKVEAEHFEQRREMSEKMAAYANENEKLQTTLSAKEEELTECEDKIARLRKKVETLEEEASKMAEKEKKLEQYEEKIAAFEEQIRMLTVKEMKLAECEEKMAELDEKINTAKDENVEILGLLAAAEEKANAAENKAAEATMAAKAAQVDATERKELQDAIKSLRSELESYRAQLASRDEELKKQQGAAATAALAATDTTASPESIAPDDNAEALRTRLATALNVLGQVQALGLQGVNLITRTNNSHLGDLHLLSVASARTSTAVPTSLSSSPTDDAQQNDEDSPEGSPLKSEMKAVRKLAAKDVPSNTNQGEEAANGPAEPKSSPLNLTREKKRAFKQAAPLSAAIEASAASAIAAMASSNSSAKSSPSNASGVAGSADVEGDWEMLE
ncbi:hypothetical protein PInf_019942 [Phytophthora infestans]|nr:hypothetical protein PInf_019942 [Phytophthora infestans]